MGGGARPGFGALLGALGCVAPACGATLPVGSHGAHVASGYRGTPLRIAANRSAGVSTAVASTRLTLHASTRDHVVAAGETLWRIARNHGTTVERLMTDNSVSDVRAVRVGMRLKLPPPVGPSGAADRESGASASPGLSRAATPIPTSPPPPARGLQPGEAPRRAYPLRWPVDGTITSRFGQRWGRAHDGIDVSAARGTPVHAAAAAEVLFADKHGGYGNLVVLRHDDGLVTVYAHHDLNLVRKGQRVAAGQLLGRVGQSGRATGPHLHFEVRRGTTAQNPLAFLPP